jgi:hypothetical protein
MIRFGRRARRRVILVTLTGVLGSALFGLVWWRRPLTANDPGAGALAPRKLRLPFTLPCAVYSADASPIYAAIRGRDRALLMNMVSQKRVMIVKRGTSVALIPFNETAVVSIDGGVREGHSCYVPSDIIPVIERRIAR